MVHVVVETTQFLVYRRRSQYAFGDNRLGTQDDQEDARALRARSSRESGVPVWTQAQCGKWFFEKLRWTTSSSMRWTSSWHWLIQRAKWAMQLR